ncbi:hypothetical protein PInf_005995 [Phytophthora infestans]|nr:hypothetical protein PInf_005995 [Phytophthora infestans]
MTSVSNRELCRFFYVADAEHFFTCNYCGTQRKQLPSSGYANLVGHLKDKHPGYHADYDAHQRRQAGWLTDSLWVRQPNGFQHHVEAQACLIEDA